MNTHYLTFSIFKPQSQHEWLVTLITDFLAVSLAYLLQYIKTEGRSSFLKGGFRGIFAMLVTNPSPALPLEKEGSQIPHKPPTVF